MQSNYSTFFKKDPSNIIVFFRLVSFNKSLWVLFWCLPSPLVNGTNRLKQHTKVDSHFFLKLTQISNYFQETAGILIN